MCAFFSAATLSCCSDRRKSLGPSAPIAYATFVSPPDEAVAWPGRRCCVLDDAVARQGRRCWVANNADSCPWQSSCKSPRTLQKCKLLITRQLAFGAVLDEHKLSSPSTRLKFNHLCIRYLCFESVRGDLQEAHVYDKRLCGYASRCQSLSFRAQNRGFCALLGSGTLVFGLFEHKIEVFVRFCPSKTSFSGCSSTKSGFLCAFGV